MTGDASNENQKTRLTSRSVKGFLPGPKRYLVHDTEIAGFRLSVSKTGKKSFSFRYRVGGGRTGTIREPKIGDYPAMTPEQARRIAQSWAAEVRLGADPSGERQRQRDVPLMQDLFTRYLEDHARAHKKPSSIRNDESLIRNQLLPAFGKQKVSEVDRAAVQRFHKSMSGRPYLANRALALLSKTMKLAELWGLRDAGSNPTHHVQKYRETARQRYLSKEEAIRLVGVFDQATRDGCLPDPQPGKQSRTVPISCSAIAALKLLMLTGARCSEILQLRWEWVDFENRKLSLPDSKGNVHRTIHLNDQALGILQALPRGQDNPYVIVGAKPGKHLVNIKDPWRVIRINAGLQDFRIHDLRHSFASFAAASGMSLPIIGALLGHSQPATTARYAHLADDPLKTAAALVGGMIDAFSTTNAMQSSSKEKVDG